MTVPVTDGDRLVPRFWRFWGAITISGLGNGLRITAFAVFAATLTRDPTQVALVTVAAQLPWLLAGPFTGALVDRVNRWRALWVCDAIRAAVMTALVVAILLEAVNILVLCVVAFVMTTVETAADNLTQAVTLDLVVDRPLDRANSWLQGGRFVTTEFLGAPLGAALFVAHQHLPFLVDAATFAIAMVLVLSISPRARPTPPSREPLLAGVRRGLGWLFRHRVLRTVCLVVGVANLATAGAFAIAVLYALEVLRVSRAAYGLLLVVIAAGGLVGLVLAPVLSARWGLGRSLQLTFLACPLALLAGGLTSHALVAASAFAFVGMSISVGNVLTTSLRQRLVPTEMFGKVTGAYRLVVSGTAPAGALLAGTMASQFGLRAPFLFGAGIIAIAAVLGLRPLSNRVIGSLLDAVPADAAGPTPPALREPSRTR